MLDIVSDATLEWLDNIACAEMEITDFFVVAGHVISPAVLENCRRCPVRRECVERVYEKGILGGYFAGMSPGQRRSMSLEAALEYIDADPPRS